MSTVDGAQIAERWHALRADVDRRGGPLVRIIAVSKRQPIDAIRAALDAGVRELGENYVQELVEKTAALAAERRDHPDLVWHMIGQLQTRKVRQLAGVRPIIHTIDRARLVDEVASRLPASPVLVQVNLSGQENRGGCAIAETEDVVSRAQQAGLEVRGLMGVASQSDQATVAAEFRALVAEADRLCLPDRCIGMSGDYPLALDCGATIIRVGTAIFGDRPADKLDTRPRASTEKW